ncbi:hypothetical protein M413DRAFT_448054 [Hebeloma cylindrosporum]|uniref:Uncharacterized protein n=1 Tax=Hebeloma cylindrosporum TaxID=76867 RepID=A0A0C3C326_HEBCY|nr:hypothetical protein M413DRAFT_448054 [Hebeloma cylindrosporum h7]
MEVLSTVQSQLDDTETWPEGKGRQHVAGSNIFLSCAGSHLSCVESKLVDDF